MEEPPGTGPTRPARGPFSVQDPAPEEVRELFDYSAADGTLLWKVACAQRVRKGMVAGGVQNHQAGKRWQVKIRYRLYLRARVVWIHHYGPIPESLTVIHIDGNTLNDRVENLALVDKGKHFQRIGGTRRKKKDKLEGAGAVEAESGTV